MAGVLCSICLACTPQATQQQGNLPTAESTPQTNRPRPKDPLFFIEGQLCQHLREIYQDSEGNLWFGTNIYDLMRYDGDSLVYITRKEGFSGGRITGILENPKGTLWFATARGLNRLEGGTFSLLDEEDGLAHPELWCLTKTQADAIWMGHTLGLSKYENNQIVNHKAPNPGIEKVDYTFYPGRVTEIIADPKGFLWVGTDGYGILQFTGTETTPIQAENQLPDLSIGCMLLDRKGNLWIGTFNGGLSCYDGKRFINYTQLGLLEGVEISALYEDQNGDIWIGVENNGIYRYDGGTFHHIKQDELHQATILCFYRDREDRFWLGGWGGLFRYWKDTIVPVTKEGPWD